MKTVPALLGVVLAGALATAAYAQTPPNEYSVNNSILTATLGVRGTVSGAPWPSNRAGRLGLAETVTPSELMMYAGFGPHMSYVTVRIDGGPPTPGSDSATQTTPGWDLIFGDVGSNEFDFTTTNQKADQGKWITEPTTVTNGIIARWTTLPGANVTNPIPPIEVDLKITLIHDMAQYQFTVINNDTRSHTVGLRLAQDIDAATVILPVHTSSFGPVTRKTDLNGSLVPTTWYANYATGAIGGGVLIGNSLNSSVTRADRFVVGTFADVPASIWNFTDTPNADLTGADVSVGVYFNPTVYAAGERKVITTYYGRNHSTFNFDGTFIAGVDAPFSVKFDPTAQPGQQFTPNPVLVTAFAYNTKNTALQNVTAVISVPPGFNLATGETVSKNIGSIAPNSEGTVSWSLVPTGTATGVQHIGVSFSATPGSQGSSVTRDIELPALPSQNFQGGISMVSFPFTFDDASPAAALGLNPIDFDLLRWNPVQNVYEAVQQIVPGQGYWLRLASTRTINLQGAHPTTVGTSPFEIPLRSGWEQIGDPYAYAIRWADVQVISTDTSDPNSFQPLSVDDAAQKGWISSTLYSYDPVSGEYVFDNDLTAMLVPFEGYWVHALRPNISLLIPPTSGRAVRFPGGRAAKSRSMSVPGGWTLRIAANGEHSQDTYNFIGLSTGANDGLDKLDVEKPPAIQGSVRMGIARPNWGRRAGIYSADIQALGGRKQWDVVVTTPNPNENVTLSWPEISRLPRGYELYITDKATNDRKLMRQTASLRVNTGTAASRSFVITAEPRSSGTQALVLNTTLAPTGSRAAGAVAARININASTDATFSVRVLGVNSRVVRQIVSGRAASAGKDASITWDGKDSRGVSVPSGVYQFEVKGVTPDGQSARRIIPFTVVR